MFEAVLILSSVCQMTSGPPCTKAIAEQLDNLYISVEATPTEIRLGDVVFVRISIVNRGKKPVLIPQFSAKASRETGTLSIYLYDRKHETEILLGPPLGAGDLGGGGPYTYREIKPGERLLLGYDQLQIPPLECTEWPFWNPKTISDGSYELIVALGLEFGDNACSCPSSIRNLGPRLNIRPRPEAEMAKLIQLCRYRRGVVGNKILPYFDEDDSRPHLGILGGLWHAPQEASLPKNLATLEEILSPGSMRDIVHLTRLAQAAYDEKNAEQKQKKLDELLGWLGDRPEIERKWMTERMIEWAMEVKNSELKRSAPCLFPYEIVHGVSIIPPITDVDREASRKRRHAHLHYHPEATDDLNAIEARRKAAQKRFEERRKRRKLREREKDLQDIENDPLDPFPPSEPDEEIRLKPDSEK